MVSYFVSQPSFFWSRISLVLNYKRHFCSSLQIISTATFFLFEHVIGWHESLKAVQFCHTSFMVWNSIYFSAWHDTLELDRKIKMNVSRKIQRASSKIKQNHVIRLIFHFFDWNNNKFDQFPLNSLEFLNFYL